MEVTAGVGAVIANLSRGGDNYVDKVKTLPLHPLLLSDVSTEYTETRGLGRGV